MESPNCIECDKRMMKFGSINVYICCDCNVAVSYECCAKCGGETLFDLATNELRCKSCDNVASGAFSAVQFTVLDSELSMLDRRDPPLKPDSRVNPQYYNSNKIQPIEYIMANGLGFAEGNIVKYVTRWKGKNGVEDLKKAKRYIDFLINQEEGRPITSEGE